MITNIANKPAQKFTSSMLKTYSCKITYCF